jgi:hypothetical protein
MAALPALGMLVAVARSFFINLVGPGVRYVTVLWSSMPVALQTIMVWFGVAEGIDFIMDLFGDDDETGGGTLPSGLEGDIVGLPGRGRLAVVKTWIAEVRQKFYLLSDGRIATQKKSGVWKTWRPKKPVVIYGSGKADLKDLLKADRIIGRQTKKLAKLTDKRKTRTVTVYICAKCRSRPCSC